MTWAAPAASTHLGELAVAMDPDRLGQIVESIASAMVGGGETAFYEVDDRRQVLVSTRRRPTSDLLAVLPIRGEGAAARSALHRRTVQADPPDGDWACPGILHGRLRSVLWVSTPAGPVSPECTGQLEGLAAEASVVLEYVSRLHGYSVLQTRNLEMWTGLLERSGTVPLRHDQRVGAIALLAGRVLDLSQRSLSLLWQAARYHDVGKLMLPGLDAAGVERFHARAAAEHLDLCPDLRDVASLVAVHHGRMDGTGLEGREVAFVPLEGWVLAFAEHLVEEGEQEGLADPERWLREFVATRMGSHHPSLRKAAAALVERGWLQAEWRRLQEEANGGAR